MQPILPSRFNHPSFSCTFPLLGASDDPSADQQAFLEAQLIFWLIGATGQILLVSQGARLIGSYDSVVAFGQKRALVVWQRIVLPDGSSLRIDNVPVTDVAGYAGLDDKVDVHTWALLKGIGLATLLGVSTELTISGESDLVQAIRESTQQNVARAGDRITQRNLDIQPTIKIRRGTPVRLVVQKDLILAPWRGRGG